MRRALSVLMVLLALTALLVSCASPAQPSPTTAPAPATAAPAAPTTAPAAPTAATGAAPSGEPIVIGAAVGLTGFLEPYDATATHMLELAIEDINAAGGVLKRPVKLVTADIKSDAKLGGNAALEVLDKGAKMVMVTCDFDFGSPAALATTNKGVIAFSSCAASPKFGIAGIGPLAFTMATGTPAQGYLEAEWAYNKQGWKTVYILLDDSLAVNRTLDQYFEERWTQIAGKDGIVGKDTFLNADTSIASQITKIKSLAKQPDFIFFPTYPPGGATALRQIRAAGIDLPVVSGESMDGDFWLDAVPNLSNFYHIAYVSLTGDDPDAKLNKLLQRYKAKYGTIPATSHSVTGYSVGEAWAKAVETAGTLDSVAVKDALESFDKVPLLVGPTTFTSKLHINVARPMRIIQIQNGKSSFMTVYGPEKAPDIQ